MEVHFYAPPVPRKMGTERRRPTARRERRERRDRRPRTRWYGPSAPVRKLIEAAAFGF